MCLMMRLTPQSEHLTTAEITDIYGRNSDGFGAVWIDDGKVRTYRTVPKDAAEAIDLGRRWNGRDAILHWRMATHGVVSKTLAHPFTVDRRMVLAHNGIVSEFAPPTRDGTESDTSRLVDHLRTVDTSAARHAILTSLAVGSVFAGVDNGEWFWHGRQIQHKGRVYSNTYAWAGPWGDDDDQAFWTSYGVLGELLDIAEDTDPGLASVIRDLDDRVSPETVTWIAQQLGYRAVYSERDGWDLY